MYRTLSIGFAPTAVSQLYDLVFSECFTSICHTTHALEATMAVFTDNAPHVFAAVCTLAVVSCVVFPLRVYVRLSKPGAWGYDDWCMTAGFVCHPSPCQKCYSSSTGTLRRAHCRLSSRLIPRHWCPPRSPKRPRETGRDDVVLPLRDSLLHFNHLD